MPAVIQYQGQQVDTDAYDVKYGSGPPLQHSEQREKYDMQQQGKLINIMQDLIESNGPMSTGRAR